MQLASIIRYEGGTVTGNDLKAIVQGFMRSDQNLLNSPITSPWDKRYLEGRLGMATTLLGFVLRLDDSKLKGEIEMELTLAKKPTTVDEAGLRAGNGEIAQALLKLASTLPNAGDCVPLDVPGLKIENVASTLYHLRKAQKISHEFGIRRHKEKKNGKLTVTPYFVRGDRKEKTA